MPAPPPTPLDKQIVSWPLTGGLDTKTAPLAQEPGSFLTLDNVRQERGNEWRNRQGITHDAGDDVPGAIAPLRFVPLKGGGAMAMGFRSNNVTSALQYTPSLPSGSRWTRPATSQINPSVWSRQSVATDNNQITQYTIAVGTTFRLIAWRVPTGVRATLISNTEGSPGTNAAPVGTFGGATAQAPKAIYEATSNRFLLFWAEGANLNVAQWNGATGAIITASTTLKGDMAGPPYLLDAILYPSGGNANVTVVYKWTGSFARQLEVNPSTLAVPTDVDLAVRCDNTLALFPDPEQSGVRFVGLCTNGNVVRVLRTNSAGAISSNDLIQNGIAATNIIGCGYQAGAGFMTVYGDLLTGSLIASKKYSGSLATPVVLTPGYGTAAYLDSNAWRENGTDAMRFMAGLHIGGVGTSATADTQHNYYEMAIEYDNGSATVSNQYTEPQARLLPLNAGPPLGQTQSLAQVVRTAANTFVLPLGRLARFTLAAGVQANQYAVDQWQVTYPTGAMSGLNVGPGLTGTQASYLPLGSLQQTVTGQLVVAHGASALPFQPTCVLAAGAGLTSGAVYQYKVTDERYDEAGNVWASGASIASNPITPSAGNLRVTVTVRLAAFEHAFRYRVVKTWRTLGNGSTFQLVDQRTILCDQSNATFSFTDSVTDATLALSNFLPPGLPVTITPAFNHIANFDGRMWGAERDFPSRLRYSFPIQAGGSPEYSGEFVVSGLDDEYGDITGIAPVDDKLIVFKDAAIYFVPMGGPNNDGSGHFYEATRITADQGAKLGTPYLSTGDIVYFIGHTGVYSISRSLEIKFLGMPIDKYFNQSLVTTPETPISFTRNRDRNEIRLLTTNYRFVYQTIFGTWVRDTGGPAGAIGMYELPGVGDMFVRSNGQIWFDYTVESTARSSDASGDFTGIIRSPWMRPANVEGLLRLYAARSLWIRTGGTGSWPTTKIYRNNDDTLFETFPVVGTTTTTPQVIEARPVNQKVTAFSLEYQLPPQDIQWRIDQWCVRVAAKKGFYRRPRAALGRQSALPPTGPILWLKSNTGITRTSPATGATVTLWADQSGHSRDAALNNGGGLPIIEPTIDDGKLDGQPGVLFTDSDGVVRPVQLLRYGAASPPDPADPLVTLDNARTIFIVAMPMSNHCGPLFTWDGLDPGSAQIPVYVNDMTRIGGTQYGYWDDQFTVGPVRGAFAAPVVYTNEAHCFAYANTVPSPTSQVFCRVDNTDRPITPNTITVPPTTVNGYTVGGMTAFIGGTGDLFSANAWFFEVIAYSGYRFSDTVFMAQMNAYLHLRFPSLPVWA